MTPKCVTKHPKIRLILTRFVSLEIQRKTVLRLLSGRFILFLVLLCDDGRQITTVHQFDSSSWCTLYIFITPSSCLSLSRSLSPPPRTQQQCADVSFLLHYTLATHPGGQRVCVCVLPLESFQVPRCHPADQTSRRKARCFSAPSTAAAASLAEAGAKDRLMRPRL